MNNITEKYNGKNGNEGDILYFIITDYHINLKAKNILVKYEMVSNNLLDNFEKGRVKKIDIKDLREESSREGMSGISTRFITKALDAALSSSEKNIASSIQ